MPNRLFCFFALSGLLTLSLRAQPPVTFQDSSSLLPFTHASAQFGGTGLAGAAWFDFNNDGFLDLFLTNGSNQQNALLQNNGNGTFSDVASMAGVANGTGNVGVIAGDIDNDGFQDLFLNSDGGLGANPSAPVRLYHNNGNGTFTDITASSGILGPATDISAAFADIDNDGFLDLFIAAIGSSPFTGPNHRNKLYHNNGNLTFTDISTASGVDTMLGACAPFFSDFDNDGQIDLFVANCNNVFLAPTPIELFRNNGNLTFTNVSASAGLTPGGFWMGCSPFDYDNDGDIDLFATNVGGAARPHALYRNNGDGTYTNVAAPARIGILPFGWGCASPDFDNDGYSDLFFTGSLPSPGFSIIGPGLGNPGSLFFNNQSAGFTNFSASLPVNLQSQFTSGVASGDYDNDGFPDLVVALDAFGTNPTGQPLLLHNQGNSNHWVTLKLQGTQSNRDAIGARVKVVAGTSQQVKEIYAGSSFASMHSQWLTFGLDQNAGTNRIEVRWPQGGVEIFPNITTGTTATLVEGQGSPAAGLSGTLPLTLGTTASMNLDTASPNAPLLVLVDLALGTHPLGPGGFWGRTQLAFTPAIFALADATATFGPGLGAPSTDATGLWSINLSIANNPALLPITAYSEAYIIDPNALNGLFLQSNLLTITFQ